jgi:3-oxoacyl-[acyl-carrier-protein] synthase III
MSFGARILSFGRAVPETVVTNYDLEKLFDTSDEWIFKRTGIKERRVIDPSKTESATSLASLAAKRAIKNAKITIEDIDLIICATATGDHLFPSTACSVQKELGMTRGAAFDISAACTGYIYALNTAYNFIYAGQAKKVLVLGVDLMSKFIDWGDRRTAVIFGDGAGATILEACEPKEDNFKSFYIRSEPDLKDCLSLPSVASHYPLKAEEIQPKPFMVNMDGQTVYQFAVVAMPDAIEEACKRAKILPEELDLVVPHQANIRIIESASKRLKIALEKFICNIDRYGNTSAASIPIAYDEAFEEGKIPQGKKKIAFVGFGAGLTWGACILEF